MAHALQAKPKGCIHAKCLAWTTYRNWGLLLLPNHVISSLSFAFVSPTVSSHSSSETEAGETRKGQVTYRLASGSKYVRRPPLLFGHELVPSQTHTMRHLRSPSASSSSSCTMQSATATIIGHVMATMRLNRSLGINSHALQSYGHQACASVPSPQAENFALPLWIWARIIGLSPGLCNTSNGQRAMDDGLI